MHHSTIKFWTKSIEPSLCDYSDAYILVTGNITLTRTIAACDNLQRKQPFNAATQVIFKNWAPSEKYSTEMVLLLMKRILLILQCLCTVS